MTSTAPAPQAATSDAAERPRATRGHHSLVDRLVRRPALLDLLICLGFLALAGWVTSGLWPDPQTRTLALNPQDQVLYEWFLAHDTLLFSGDFRLISDRMNAPDGVNLLANTTVIALGALFTPVTLLFGAGTTFAVLVALNLAGTASAWYLLFRRTMQSSRAAAAIGGGFCGFAPGMVSQSNSHLHMTAQFLIPAMVWCVVMLARAAREPATGASRLIRAAALFGVLVAVQVFIGEETLFLTALTLIVVTLVYLARSRPRRAEIEMFGSGLLIAVGVATTLLAYPLYVQFLGPLGVRDGVFSPHYFSADLAGFVAFSPLSLAGDEAAARLSTGAAEYNTFLGWPLVLLAVGLAVWLRRDAVALAGSVAALIMSLMALGPHIVIDGERTAILGPFALLDGLPLVDGALPMRFALAAIPLIGMLLAKGWDHARRSPLPVLRFGVPVLVVVALLPTAPMPLPAADRPPLPRFYADGYWRNCAAPGDVLLPVPPAIAPKPEPMRYATATNTAFAIPDGFFIGPYGPPGRASMGVPPRPTTKLLTEVARTGMVPAIDDTTRAHMRADLAHWNVRCVVLTAHPQREALRSTVDGLLGPGTPMADAIIWRVG